MAVRRRDQSQDADLSSRSGQATEKKKCVISFRVSRDEWDALEDSARAARESVSDYVRQALKFRQSPRFPISVEATTGGATFTFYAARGTILNAHIKEAPGTLTLDCHINPIDRRRS